jgi:hypothetical protein
MFKPIGSYKSQSIMPKPLLEEIQHANGKSFKSLLQSFERTIDENNRVGVNSGMYLTTNAYITQPVATSKSRRKGQQNDARKKISNVAILATLDEMTDLADAINCFDGKSFDHSGQKNNVGVNKDKPVTTTVDIDEMSISSFHSGSRRASSIISRPVSIGSETEGGGCGGSVASNRSKNSAVARPSARIRELPRDIQIGSSGYDTTDDEDSDCDSDDDDDRLSTRIQPRYW